MPEYKLRPLRVHAVKVEKILEIPPANLPEWVDSALADGRIIKLPAGTITVDTLQGKRIGTLNDMVIKTMRGDFYLDTKVGFLAEYEAV